MCAVVGRVPAAGGNAPLMTTDPIPRLSGAAPSDAMRARWARLADDFARLPVVAGGEAPAACEREVLARGEAAGKSAHRLVRAQNCHVGALSV